MFRRWHLRVVAPTALAAVLVGGCSEGPRAAAPSVPVAPSDPSPATTIATPTAPSISIPPIGPVEGVRCPLTVRLDIRPLKDGRHELTVLAESTVTYAQELELPDRCPQGLVGFDGLGSGYDFYGACTAGACPGTPAPHRIRVGANERVPIGSTTISERGGSCTKPIAPGRYTIRPVLPEGVNACVVPASLDVGARMPPPATGAIGTDIYSCTQASDCILSCPKVEGCCSSSCGCRHAINKAHRTNYEAAYKNTCQKPPKCPAEGCAFNPAMGVDCRDGRCVATDHP